MVANRYPDVRATVYYDGPREVLDLSKEHNKANMLSIGARFVSQENIALFLMINITVHILK